ncbi:MAG: hypothetical protein RR387_07080 [Clostridiales bacterium]
MVNKIIGIGGTLFLIIFIAILGCTLPAWASEVTIAEVPLTGDGETLFLTGIIFAVASLLLLVLILIAIGQEKKKK